jgi:hypothetical protein
MVLKTAPSNSPSVHPLFTWLQFEHIGWLLRCNLNLRTSRLSYSACVQVLQSPTECIRCTQGYITGPYFILFTLGVRDRIFHWTAITITSIYGTYITNQLILRPAFNSVNMRINLNKVFHISSLQFSYQIYLTLNAVSLFPYFPVTFTLSKVVSRKTSELHSRLHNTSL